MISPATPRLATREPQVSFRVDPTAEPGDPLPALVRLLIGIRRTRQERAAELAGEKNPQAKPDTPNP